MKKTTKKPKREWGEWKDITYVGGVQRTQRIKASIGNNEKLVKVVQNNIYHVMITDVQYPDAPLMFHLSIKAIDQTPRHDWREFQRIKRELVGEENEGVEIYPANSRLVDTSNQYHLWVFADPELRFSFGYFDRAVSGPEYDQVFGSKQRPFPADDSPKMTPVSPDVIKKLKSQRLI